MGSILRPKSSGESTSQTVVQSPQKSYTLPTSFKVNQKPSINCPNQTHQFNEYLLFESEFHGDTYVSAHLQRLQHGLVDSPNVHGDRKHVTFVAVEFCFHPAFEHDHRFKNCIIEVTASRDNQVQEGKVVKEMLRFIKYAPHLAFGRISSESLKWNFQLGAKLGVTQGPVDVSINPSGSYERDRTVGTMMKIQGTTRSLPVSLLPPGSVTHNPPNRHDLRDRRIVWSLEENDQQEAGLPREFTFVFLVEQPHVEGGHVVNDMVVGDISTVFKDLTIGIKVKPSVTGFGVDGFDNQFQYTTVRGEIGQRFCTADEFQLQSQRDQPQPVSLQLTAPITAVKDSATTVVRKGTATMKKQLSSSGTTNGTGNATTTTKTSNTATTPTSSSQPTKPTATTQTAAPSPSLSPSPSKPPPTSMDLTATPTTDNKAPTLADSVDGPATDAITGIFKRDTKANGSTSVSFGNVFGASNNNDSGNVMISEKPRTDTLGSEKSLAPETEKKLFNFALMEGNFEDLIELPGNAVTSMQPTLRGPK